jgi:hypothetical protein
MAAATYLPYHYVDHLHALTFTGGVVKLKQYMCKTQSNGGNDSATSLFKNLRWLKDGGTGPTLNTLAGGRLIDEALKGQGQPKTFVAIWDFMCRNKEQLKKLKVEACGGREKESNWEKQVLRTGNVYDLYFAGNSDQQAIQKMIADRFFGIDCIGFAAGVLIYNGEWTEYKGAEPAYWPKWHCKEEVSKAADIKALDFMLWDGHIAMIDWVWEHPTDKSVRVDICQSSDIGPHYNTNVIIKETNQTNWGGRRVFKFENTGSPPSPVTGHFYIQRRKDFFW